jgi:hypothetical protein
MPSGHWYLASISPHLNTCDFLLPRLFEGKSYNSNHRTKEPKESKVFIKKCEKSIIRKYYPPY